jgi:Flp pilus assembly protein TadG
MINKFFKSTRGNMAITTAIGMSTMLVAIGAAWDLSATSNKQQSLQDMVDNATLAAAKSKKRKKSELKVIVDKVLAQHNTENWPLRTQVSIKDDVLYVKANTSYKTLIMGMVGKKKVAVAADAASPLAIDIPINLALVLDTTGSMAGSNIKDLKSASQSMLDELTGFDSKLRISVVPFGKYVNVGLKQKRANWLDISKDGTFEEREHCYDEKRTIKEPVCTGTGTYSTRDNYSDGVYTGTSRWENKNCTPGEYEPTGNRICEMRRTDYTWHGCVGSRQSPYNEQAPYASRKIPGIMNETCGSEMIPLTSNIKKVERTIKDLTTSGETYLPSGIMWGWRSLQKDQPFTEIAKGGKKQLKYASNAMVIMTDGENTLSQSSNETHNARDTDDADKRTAILCERAKEDDIQIFTVGYRMGTGRDHMETLLRNCATKPTNYFDANSAAELEKAFKEIANSLDFTRLTL